MDAGRNEAVWPGSAAGESLKGMVSRGHTRLEWLLPLGVPEEWASHELLFSPQGPFYGPKAPRCRC